jgi:hypothetical protein
MTEQDHQAPADEPATPRPKSERAPLPEPSLKTFVSGLAGQVLINLGLFENPLTGKREADLEQAKYSIDLLQILQDKMRGNLTDEEAKLISAILYDLRMRYVEACR